MPFWVAGEASCNHNATFVAYTPDGQCRPGGARHAEPVEAAAVPAPCLPWALDNNDVRANAGFALLRDSGDAGAIRPRAANPNGDETKYADKSATYSKGLKQKSYGIVDPDAFKAFRAGLGTATA